MIINSSRVGMDSERSYASKSMDAVSKTTYKSSGKTGFSSLLLSSNSEKEYNGELVESKVSESSEEKITEDSNKMTLQEQMDAIKYKLKNMTSAIKNNTLNAENSLQCKLVNACLNYLLRLLFGDEFDDYLTNQICTSDSSSITGISGYEFAESERRLVTFGASYEETHYYEETENTTFSTKGTVLTDDGREIEFNLNLEMSRSFVEYTGIKKETLIEFTDPLVINLNGNIADVSDQKFLFDLDCDGNEDEISILGTNSGFLAIDKNEDGIINDGSELFGAKSGDGFMDLSEYDEDANGWIDEADSVFDRIIIWTKDKDGNERQISLKEAGVGALYTGRASTKYTLMSGMDTQGTLENALSNVGGVNAMIKSTGVFLYENGNLGTLQQVDMAKEVS